METEWNILTCPACKAIVKVAKGRDIAQMGCPKCKMSMGPSSVAVPKEIIKSVVEPTRRELPAERNFNPDAPKIRAKKEGWETQTPAPKEIDFKDKLAKTSDPTFNSSSKGEGSKKRKRRITRSEHLARLKGLDWEPDVGTPRSASWNSWQRTLSRIPWALVLLGVVGVGAVIYKVVELRKTNEVYTYVRTEPPPKAEPKNPDDKLELAATSTVLAEITPVLKDFLNAESPQALMPLIRERERVQPLMEEFYRNQQPFKKAAYRFLPTEDLITIHKRFVVAQMETPEFETFTMTFEKTPKGFLVDWESYVAYNEMPLAKFRESKPLRPTEFRMILSVESYYNHQYSDSKEWACFRLASRDKSALPLYGYVKRTDQIIEKILGAMLNVKQVYCTLKLRYSEGSAEDNQVEIADYLQTGWVFRDLSEDLPPPDSR